MPTFVSMKMIWVDQCGREVRLSDIPKRIVSLVPSQTELLHALGLENEVVGITRFCTHPSTWYRTKTRVGGTKDADPSKIQWLQPDLILANKEENDRNTLEALAQSMPVWISDVRTIQSALEMMTSIGEMTGCQEKAMILTGQIKRHFEELRSVDKLRVAYLIWHEPMMTVNSDTFIHHLLHHAGFENVFGDRTDSRYPMITREDLQAAKPELIMLSSEPFPFKNKHISDYQALLPESDIRLVDGRNWSWYGSAMCEFDPMK